MRERQRREYEREIEHRDEKQRKRQQSWMKQMRVMTKIQKPYMNR